MDRQSILILSIFGAIIIAALFRSFSFNFSQIPVDISEEEQIPNELVCMVNDAFMGIEQIPVEADGKTYYGCCQMCVSKILENTGNVRYTTDPYSGEKVDKAVAFITLKPGQGKEVLYFISKNNMEAYLKKDEN
ncbi:hypothetical protein MATR_02730 [Marivirga tractuosa]|jgi:YHS domain-containing protein|uniref:TRASH transcription regulator C-terminal archaeal domain-containing protein n=2 Tax=Marivirga TaxID=869806 RepID=E4TUH2_MARTH|nr:hypothetical protein Ftrac_2108 [Marivirga tractuosa DSM 4126]BDD13448.1 hypothetical protein MATR_02730 [Marivirga tractuosa]